MQPPNRDRECRRCHGDLQPRCVWPAETGQEGFAVHSVHSREDTLCPHLGFTDGPQAGQTPLTDTQQMGLGPPVRDGQNQAESQGRGRGLWAGSSSCSAQGHWLESGSL